MKQFLFKRGTKTCKLIDHKGHLRVFITGFNPCLTSITSNLTKKELEYVARYFLAFIANHKFVDEYKLEIQDYIRYSNYAQLFGSKWPFEKKGWK